MAIDNNYLIPSLVVIVSALKNKNHDTLYKFFFLISNNFSNANKTVIARILREKSVNYSFINIDERYTNNTIFISHTSQATFYRLMIPELLSIDRCIYLDSDLIVLDDLSSFYHQIEDSKMILGVKAATYYWPESSRRKKAEYLKIEKLDTYINAGVLVLNLKLMRQMNIIEKFSQLQGCDFVGQDQDIINCACYGYIQIASPKFNSMTKYRNDRISSYDSVLLPCISKCYTREEWKDACIAPVIIHYADFEKPWNSNVPFFELWWHYLKEVDIHYKCYDNVRNLYAINKKSLIDKAPLKIKLIKHLIKGYFFSD